MLIFSPIDQFHVIPILELTNISLFLFLVLLSSKLIMYNGFLFNKHVEWWFPNLKNIHNHIFLILTIWFLILLSNVIGLVPYSTTVTAQGIIVLCIAIPTFIAINIVGLRIHNLNLTYLFLPTGVPTPIIPLIVILEILSYFIRAVSLTLRLTANMISGHILIKIIIYAVLSLPFLSPLLLPILCLEFLVAGLQSYVMVTLINSYYQDVFLPH